MSDDTPLVLNITAELKAALEAQCAKNDRTLDEEVVYRLERTLQQDGWAESFLADLKSDRLIKSAKERLESGGYKLTTFDKDE